MSNVRNEGIYILSFLAVRYYFLQNMNKCNKNTKSRLVIMKDEPLTLTWCQIKSQVKHLLQTIWLMVEKGPLCVWQSPRSHTSVGVNETQIAERGFEPRQSERANEGENWQSVSLKLFSLMHTPQTEQHTHLHADCEPHSPPTPHPLFTALASYANVSPVKA